MTTQMNRYERFATHLAYLRDDPQNGRAALAALRRGINFPPGRHYDMYRYLSPVLNDAMNERQLAVTMRIASLFGLHPASGDVGNLGDSFRIAAHSAGSTVATERRFAILLASDEDDLDQHLIRAVTFLRSCSAPVQWDRLYRDALSWGHPDGFVQRAWARSFWRSAPPTTPAVSSDLSPS